MHLHRGHKGRKVVAIGNITGCVETEYLTWCGDGSEVVNGGRLELPFVFTPPDRVLGDLDDGKWGYVFSPMKQIEPVKARGQQGGWNWE